MGMFREVNMLRILAKARDLPPILRSASRILAGTMTAVVAAAILAREAHPQGNARKHKENCRQEASASAKRYEVPAPLPLTLDEFWLLYADAGWLARTDLSQPPVSVPSPEELARIATRHGGRLVDYVSHPKLVGSAYWIAIPFKSEGDLLGDLLTRGITDVQHLNTAPTLKAAARWKFPETFGIAVRSGPDNIPNRYVSVAWGQREALLETQGKNAEFLVVTSLPEGGDLPSGRPPLASEGKDLSCQLRVRAPAGFSSQTVADAVSAAGGRIEFAIAGKGLFLASCPCRVLPAVAAATARLDARLRLEEPGPPEKFLRSYGRMWPGIGEFIFATSCPAEESLTDPAFCISAALSLHDAAEAVSEAGGHMTANAGGTVIHTHISAAKAAAFTERLLREPGFTRACYQAPDLATREGVESYVPTWQDPGGWRCCP